MAEAICVDEIHMEFIENKNKKIKKELDEIQTELDVIREMVKLTTLDDIDIPRWDDKPGIDVKIHEIDGLRHMMSAFHQLKRSIEILSQ